MLSYISLVWAFLIVLLVFWRVARKGNKHFLENLGLVVTSGILIHTTDIPNLIYIIMLIVTIAALLLVIVSFLNKKKM